MDCRLNGQPVSSVTRVPWREADQHRLIEGARIVGRAVVVVQGGGTFNGLVVKRWQWDNSVSRAVEVALVVVWERDGSPAGVFRALDLDGR